MIRTLHHDFSDAEINLLLACDYAADALTGATSCWRADAERTAAMHRLIALGLIEPATEDCSTRWVGITPAGRPVAKEVREIRWIQGHAEWLDAKIKAYRHEEMAGGSEAEIARCDAALAGDADARAYFETMF